MGKVTRNAIGLPKQSPLETADRRCSTARDANQFRVEQSIREPECR
jgi:hypothetical protein